MGCSIAPVGVACYLGGRFDPRQHHSYMTRAMKTASKKTIVKKPRRRKLNSNHSMVSKIVSVIEWSIIFLMQ
jgi:hypothetical protein